MLFPFKRFTGARRTDRTNPTPGGILDDEPPLLSIIDTLGHELTLKRLDLHLYKLTRTPGSLKDKLDKAIAVSLSRTANRGLCTLAGIQPAAKIYPYQVSTCRSIVYLVKLHEDEPITVGSQLELHYGVQTGYNELARRPRRTGVHITVNQVLPRPATSGR